MQNDMRDRLIEIIGDKPFTTEYERYDSFEWAEHFADHLIANGVVVPPCKVGQTVWFIRKSGLRNELIETTVEKIISKKGGIFLKLACNSMYETSCNSIGKTVFLTKDQAEQKLKELSENG